MICPFCRELQQPSYGCALLGEDWPFKDRLLAQSPDAFAIAGYGPQVFPYALVVTNRHIVSLTATSASERKSILQCLDALRTLPALIGKSVSVFEHGGSGPGSCACLEHCHLHVIDGRYPIMEWLLEEEICRSVSFSATQMFEIEEPYVFAGRYSGGEIQGAVAKPEVRMSQYFRHMLALRLGERAWDWRMGMNMAFIRKLVTQAKR